MVSGGGGCEVEGKTQGVREEPRRSAWCIGDHSGLGRRGVFLPRFGASDSHSAERHHAQNITRYWL